MFGRWLVVLAVAACSGRGTTPISRERAPVRLVRCAPATPPPQSGDAIETPATARPGGGGGGRPWKRATGKPAVAFGAGTASGSLTREEVAAGAKLKQPEILACFTGSSISRVAVVYHFTVAADGAVGNVDSSSGGLGGPLDTCVRRTLRALKFPAKSGPTTVHLPLIYDNAGVVPADDKPAIEPDPWTPFAIGTTVASATASGAARATEAAVRQRLPAIDACFATPVPTGSLRILVELDISGELSSVRAGGIGDKDIEACAAKALSGLHVMTPAQEHVEVACDLARGDARPWRVSPAATGYQLIEIDGRGPKQGTVTLVPGVSDPDPLPAATYVVVAAPDTLGGMVQLALMWAREATTVLLAVADGKAPPVFLGMGNTSPSEDGGEGVRAALRVGGKEISGCVGRASHEAKAGNPALIGVLVNKLAARCRTVKCPPTLVVSIDSDALVRDLLEVSGAARRAGFDRVLFGGSELSGCVVDMKTEGGEIGGALE